MNKTLTIFAACLFAFSFYSCKKSINDEANQDQSGLTGDKFAPDGFDYTSTKSVELSVRLLSADNKPIAGVLTSIYNPNDLAIGSEISRMISDKDGYIRTTVVVPAAVSEIVVDPAYIGLARTAKFALNGNTLTAIIGGDKGISANFVPSIAASSESTKYNFQSISAGRISTGNPNTPSTVYVYDQNKFDELGRPLSAIGQTLDPTVNFPALMAMINASLPERKNGIDLHPEYISTSAPSHLRISTLTDVWITFVHEGADYRNSLAYYTYNTGDPPASASAIDSIHLVFPNASLFGAVGAGNMRQGDKVKIGRFPAGKSIGFVLLQKAYNNDKSITTGSSILKFYGDEHFNPEPATSLLRRHNVLLQTPGLTDKLFVIGFEDVRRDVGDNDFNDLVFFAQTNAVNSVDPTNIPYLEDRVIDTDGDGVPDVNDEYPTDNKRVYNRYYPSKNLWGTLAFEDKWPFEGDYDFNDLVLSYRYTFVMDNANKVKDVISDLKPLAAGAVYTNGFGIQFSTPPSGVSSVTGQKLSAASYVSLSANGTESGQANTVIIPFDNHKALFKTNAAFINTRGSGYYNADTVSVKLTFANPNFEAFTAQVPFNPFLISNSVRGNEIHLVNQKPTSLANTSLFGTEKDKSVPANNKYYITSGNRPFALNFIGNFSYPIEEANITDAYPRFVPWAASGNAQFSDWYSNMGQGYRNSSLIYQR